MAMLSGNKGAVSQINVTPLIDVLLVLLIIFMVIVPARSNGMPVVAPLPANTPSGETTAVVVQVQTRGTDSVSYQINSTAFAKNELQPKLAEIFAIRQQKIMFVKADPNLTFDQVAQVVSLGRLAGAQQIGMMTPMSEAGR